MDGEALAIAGARGEVGSTTDLFVQLPAGRTPATVTVNGQPAEIASRAPTGVTVRATFDGPMFRHYQPVVEVAGWLRRWQGHRHVHDSAAHHRPAGRAAQSLADPMDARGLPHHMACTGTPPVVRPDRGAGRALGRTADHRRSHGGAEEGVLRPSGARQRPSSASTPICRRWMRIVRTRSSSSCRSWLPVSCRACSSRMWRQSTRKRSQGSRGSRVLGF